MLKGIRILDYLRDTTWIINNNRIKIKNLRRHGTTDMDHNFVLVHVNKTDDSDGYVEIYIEENSDKWNARPACIIH